jgi:hypothetical protein
MAASICTKEERKIFFFEKEAKNPCDFGSGRAAARSPAVEALEVLQFEFLVEFLAWAQIGQSGRSS